ncbi:fucolectin-1-like isoform X2 [Mytilus edulis]|uniref:fucolectin-1-like isoform X2 n=1 Tax=Mytilus edulis TaxID=6550 RepID=UPI0039EFCDF2
MEWQTLFFQSAVMVLLLAVHVYLIEQKIIKSNEIIETLVDLQRQAEDLKQILKDADRSYESKMKEALHEFKENLTITLESLKAKKKKNYEDKDKDNANNNNRVIKEVARGKISKQSTQYSPSTQYISGNANDGNFNTISATKDEPLPFWEVDLGHEFKIKQIEIFVRRDCCGYQVQQLDILAGPSHNKMETCAQYEGPAQPGFHLVFECPSIVRGRYVKIQRTDASLLSLAEVRVMAFVEKSDN